MALLCSSSNYHLALSGSRSLLHRSTGCWQRMHLQQLGHIDRGVGEPAWWIKDKHRLSNPIKGNSLAFEVGRQNPTCRMFLTNRWGAANLVKIPMNGIANLTSPNWAGVPGVLITILRPSQGDWIAAISPFEIPIGSIWGPLCVNQAGKTKVSWPSVTEFSNSSARTSCSSSWNICF